MWNGSRLWYIDSLVALHAAKSCCIVMRCMFIKYPYCFHYDLWVHDLVFFDKRSTGAQVNVSVGIRVYLKFSSEAFVSTHWNIYRLGSVMGDGPSELGWTRQVSTAGSWKSVRRRFWKTGTIVRTVSFAWPILVHRRCRQIKWWLQTLVVGWWDKRSPCTTSSSFRRGLQTSAENEVNTCSTSWRSRAVALFSITVFLNRFRNDRWPLLNCYIFSVFRRDKSC